MINIILCDDDIPFLDNLNKFIKLYQEKKQTDISIRCFNDGMDLVKNYCLETDVIFLDISMKQLDGIETAKKIREIDKKVIIIFLTSIIKYALTGYSLNASSYIIKPITYSKLTIELDHAIEKIHEIENQFIKIRNNEGIFKLYINDIQFVETHDRHTLIHMAKKNVTSFYNMKTLEQKLQPYCFIRCHSSFIVNAKYIESIEKLVLTTTTGRQLPISQQKRKDVMKLIAIYLGDDLL